MLGMSAKRIAVLVLFLIVMGAAAVVYAGLNPAEICSSNGDDTFMGYDYCWKETFRYCSVFIYADMGSHCFDFDPEVDGDCREKKKRVTWNLQVYHCWHDYEYGWICEQDPQFDAWTETRTRTVIACD